MEDAVSPDMKSVDKTKYTALVNWAKSLGARLHPDVEIYNDITTKVSLRVRPGASLAAFPPGAEAVTCPASATLSYLNALTGRPLSSAQPDDPDDEDEDAEPAFPDQFLSIAPPHVIGRFFLIQQYLLGRRSYWYPYIATLPQPEHLSSWALPAFWPEEDAVSLNGTNVGFAIEEIQENVGREFKGARKLLKQAGFNDSLSYTKVLYSWAYCIFSSRSFRPSLVLGQEILRPSDEGGLLQVGDKDDDFSVLQPLFDIVNHSPFAKIRWDVKDGQCALVCEDGYPPGKQVFNNYGADKTNSELLLGYGFTLKGTRTFHNEYVHVRIKRPDAQEGDKPKDYLLSLDPMANPSSVAGRKRHMFPLVFDERYKGMFKTRNEFNYLEDTLVWDLAEMLMTDDERAALQERSQEIADKQISNDERFWMLRALVAMPPDDSTEDPDIEQLVQRIIGVLSEKVKYDSDKLQAAGAAQAQEKNAFREEDRDALDEARWKSPNWNMGSDYQWRVRGVFQTVLQSLGWGPRGNTLSGRKMNEYC